jgi:hypothetical protein
MSRCRIAFVLLISLTVIGTGCSDTKDSQTQSVTSTTEPRTDVTTVPAPVLTDEFVQAPSDLAQRQPGELIRSEIISNAVFGTTYRVLYVSRARALPATTPDADQDWTRNTAVTGTVTIPADASAALPVVSWAHPTVGLADSCAPSNDAEAIETFVSLVSTTSPVLVAATDYEGLGTPGAHPYLDGETAGYNTLDIVLAARQLAQQQSVTTTNDVVVTGYSQGGHAALWSGALAGEFPTIDLLGVAAQAPPTDLVAIADASLSSENNATLVVAGMYGAATVDSSVRLDGLLTPSAIDDLALFETTCTGDIDAFDGTGDEVFVDDPTNNKALEAQLRRASAPTSGITPPVFVSQGGADKVVPKSVTDAWVKSACTNGISVTYNRIGFADHNTLALLGAPTTIGWITDRLSGVAPASTC